MKKILLLLVSLLTIVSGSACTSDDALPEDNNGSGVSEGTGSAYFGGKKVLVAYFSWSGTTQRMAQQIQDITGVDMFRIEPVTPYPTEYTPCTEVAREEKDNNARPDFIPNMKVFTVADDVTPKGAVIICPGGAFQFRSMQNEGYDVANMLVPMGYQCFVVNYRISPYTMRESATDLQRAIRYVRAHADGYRISPENIALVGFSAGGHPQWR